MLSWLHFVSRKHRGRGALSTREGEVLENPQEMGRSSAVIGQWVDPDVVHERRAIFLVICNGRRGRARMSHVVHHPPQLALVCARALDHRKSLPDGLFRTVPTELAPRLRRAERRVTKVGQGCFA